MNMALKYMEIAAISAIWLLKNTFTSQVKYPLILHTMTQVISEFWRLPGVPLVLEGHIDPI